MNVKDLIGFISSIPLIFQALLLFILTLPYVRPSNKGGFTLLQKEII
jgi:hypothetical protein